MSNEKKRCVLGCSYSVARGARYHTFPNPEKEQDRFFAWFELIDGKIKERSPMKIFQKYRMCSRHFLPDDIKCNGYLFSNAVPQILNDNQPFLQSHQIDHSYFLPKRFWSEDSSALNNTDTLNSTNSSQQQGAYMHHFPSPTKRSEIFHKWIVIVGSRLKETDHKKIYQSNLVCDYHFRSQDKVSGHRLTWNAVPSLYLEGFVSSLGTTTSLEHNYCLPRLYESPKILGSSSLGSVPGEGNYSTFNVKDIQQHNRDGELQHNPELLTWPDDGQSQTLREGSNPVEDKEKKESKKKIKRNNHPEDANLYGVKPKDHRRSRRFQSPPWLAANEPVVYDGIHDVPRGYTPEPKPEFDDHDLLRSPIPEPDVLDIEFDFQMCRICLTPSSKLLSLESYGLSGAYEQLTGVSLEHDDGLPRELCVECATLLDKYHKFRDRSIRGDQILRKIYNENESDPKEPLEEIENKINELASKLDYSAEITCIDIDPETHVKKEQEWRLKENYTSDMDLDMSVVDTEADRPLTARSAEVVNYIDKLDNVDVVNLMNELDNADETNDIDDEVSIKEENVEFDAEITNDPLYSDEIKTEEDEDDNLLRQHFTVIHLNVKDQMTCHQEKGGSSSYLFSDYKCCMCYEGFASLADYRSHVKVHSKKRGHIVCVICRWRFDQVNDLKLHAEDTHLYKYHCLKCKETVHNRRKALRHMKTHTVETS